MSLDGLRAWIGEVERKLGVRTRVMLALALIAIGGAGAGIYLAIDTRGKAVSEGDVQDLQAQLETQIDQAGTGGGGADLTELEAEVDALRAQVEALQSKGGTSNEGGGGESEDGGTSSGAAHGGGSSGGGATSGGSAGDSGDFEDILRKAQEEAKK